MNDHKRLLEAHRAAVDRLTDLDEALGRESDGEEVDWAEVGATAPYDGCYDCVVREVLHAGIESLVASGHLQVREP